MSTDSPQIDITPYKVRRENVITSQQQKAWEPSPNEDLASSIMSKLTEIRGNLYPTHLNIPPHKSGAPQSATAHGYSYLSTSPAPLESGTLSSGVDALLKRDIPDYSAELLKSRDDSPSSISRDSPIFESSYSNPTSQPFFYSTTYQNVEVPDKNTTTIPKIEMNFASSQSHNLLGYSSKPYVEAPITKDYKTQFLTESSPQTNSPDYSPKQVDKNLFHMSNGYEPHKNSLLSTHAHSHLNFSESTKAGMNSAAQEKTNSQNGLYIPITRNNNVSPDSAATHPESKSNPTSTRATQTKVHISATARLPSTGKPASRTQLINSLNEALGLNYNRGGSTDTKPLNESSQHKRLEKSMEAPKRAGVNKGEKIPKQKNKSTVMLANIIAQNQDVESQRFSFGHVSSSDATDSARQSGRSSNYSQRDREIQAYIDTVSQNQSLRAEALEALKKRQQTPTSSTTLENQHIKSQSVSGKIKVPTDNNKILVVGGESSTREYQSKPQYIKQGSQRQTESVTNYSQPQKNNKKSSPKESYTRQSSSQSQTQNKKTSSLNQNFNEAQVSDQSQRDMRDNSHEEQGSQIIHEDSSPQDSERGTDVEDNTPKLNIGKGLQREKVVHQSTARTQAETMRHNEKSNRDATPSQVYSEIIKSKPTTANQLEDELSQVSFLKEAARTRSRLTTKSQFDNLPYDDSTSQIAHHDNRPLTRSQLDDETRDSGQGGFHRGSGSGSSSPNRSTTTDIIVAKKLDYQQNKNESPIRLREVSAHSRGGSVIEKSYYSESQERSVEKNKSATNVAESPKASKKRVSEDSIRPVAKMANQNQESRKESSEEREVIVSQTNLDAQTVNNQAPQQVFVPVNNQRDQMPQQAANFSPERQNLGFMSPQPKQFNLGNNTGQMPIGYNMPMSPNLNFQTFQMQSPIGDNDTQQQIMMITNYYQSQISSLKGMIAQQNEVINQERHKNQMFERKNMELTRTIQNLEQQIRDQTHALDSTQKELKTRYEIVLDELASLKRTMLTHQVAAPQQESHAAPKQYPTEGKEYQTLLYHEILSLRKDLENQRSTMYDFRSSTRHLEDQMKDLEKMYIDELRSNSHINNKRESLHENLESFKNNYLKMDTLNQILVDGYERTRKDLSAMKDGQNQEMAQELDSIQTSRQARGRNIYIGSPSPTKYEVEANNQEMLRNKMRAEDSQMKNILQWNPKNEGTSIHFITNNNFTPRGKRSQATSDYNQQSLLQSNQSPNGYALNRGYSPQPVQSNMQRAAITDRKANRSVAFTTYQRVEDPRDQVKRLDQTIAELGQHKKYVENELFKMPSVPKTLDQKRKKAGLELELEGVENQIEECKNQLRKY